MNPIFERLLGLLGKRFDDPEVIAFHRDAGLAPPPVVITERLMALRQVGSSAQG